MLVQVIQAGVIDVQERRRHCAQPFEHLVVQNESALEQFLRRILRMLDGRRQLHSGLSFFDRYDEHAISPLSSSTCEGVWTTSYMRFRQCAAVRWRRYY